MAPLKLGAHVSIAGGTHNAATHAKAIEATAMQIFTKQANRWQERIVEAPEQEAFKTAMAETTVAESCAHDSYLINLASPDATLRQKSLQSFIAELRRCEALGLNYLVSHPGNFIDDRDSGIARNAEAIGIGLEQSPGNVMLLMETTAGTGTAIGWNFEEMASLLAQVPAQHQHRLGVCLDTCHVYAAGYDLVNDFDGVIAKFDDIIGLNRLKMMHLNDSKHGLGTRKDRHELIGEGALGEMPFRRIMTDDRLANIAKVIETPKGDEPDVMDKKMLDRLRSYAA